MRLIGSFQTITIQGTSGSATSSRSGARSRAGAVVLMLLMTSMVAKPRWAPKDYHDRPPPHVGGPGGDRRRLSPARKVMPARSRCSSKGITVLRVVPRVALASEAVKSIPSGNARRRVATASSRTRVPRYRPGAIEARVRCRLSAATSRRSAPSAARADSLAERGVAVLSESDLAELGADRRLDRRAVEDEPS